MDNNSEIPGAEPAATTSAAGAAGEPANITGNAALADDLEMIADFQDRFGDLADDGEMPGALLKDGRTVNIRDTLLHAATILRQSPFAGTTFETRAERTARECVAETVRPMLDEATVERVARALMERDGVPIVTSYGPVALGRYRDDALAALTAALSVSE